MSAPLDAGRSNYALSWRERLGAVETEDHSRAGLVDLIATDAIAYGEVMCCD